MSNILTLNEYKNSRIIVIGSLQGEYYKLIDFLYNQDFNYKDILIFTGDFINFDNKESSQLISFIKENKNILSVKGYNEKLFIDSIDTNRTIHTKFDYSEDDIDFLRKLPLVVELNNTLYIVNSGFNFELRDDLQEPDYTIFKTNKPFDSDWYNKKSPGITFCFTNNTFNKCKVNAGYNLGDINTKLHAIVFYKEYDPIIIDL